MHYVREKAHLPARKLRQECLLTSFLFSHSPITHTEKWTGWGKLTYPDGLVYNGNFQDGQFDGEGTLTFPGSQGTVYKALWSRGLEVENTGALFFEDGLIFNPVQGAGAHAPNAPPASIGSPSATRAWPYLGGFDRRLWLEHAGGVRANIAPQRSPVKTQVGEGDVDRAAEFARGVQAGE